MTLPQWRTIACFVLVAAFVVLGVSLLRDAANTRTGATAAAVIERLTLRNDTLQAIASGAQLDAQGFKAERDSLLEGQREPRVYAARQRTAVVIDTADIVSVVQGLAAMAAERDTAILDRDSARADVERLRGTLLQLDSLAVQHALADSVRWSRVVAITDTVKQELHTVRALVRPRWYRRWGGGLKRTGQLVGVAAIAFVVGRGS